MGGLRQDRVPFVSHGKCTIVPGGKGLSTTHSNAKVDYENFAHTLSGALTLSSPSYQICAGNPYSSGSQCLEAKKMIQRFIIMSIFSPMLMPSRPINFQHFAGEQIDIIDMHTVI